MDIAHGGIVARLASRSLGNPPTVGASKPPADVDHAPKVGLGAGDFDDAMVGAAAADTMIAASSQLGEDFIDDLVQDALDEWMTWRGSDEFEAVALGRDHGRPVGNDCRESYRFHQLHIGLDIDAAVDEQQR